MQYNDYYDYDYVPQQRVIREKIIVPQEKKEDDRFFLYVIILLLICTIIVITCNFQNKYSKLLEKHIKVI